MEKIKADPVKRAGCVKGYAVDVKPPARRELETLPDSALARAIRKSKL